MKDIFYFADGIGGESDEKNNSNYLDYFNSIPLLERVADKGAAKIR